MGYVKNPGFPKYNPTDAKKLVNAYKSAHGGKAPTFALQSTFDEQTKALAQETKRQMALIGINVTLPAPVDQATIINQAIGSQVDSFLWRNYPGQDPDTLYVWFYGGSPVNFNHIDDPVVNSDLDKGRSGRTPDQTARKGYYETSTSGCRARCTTSGPGTRTGTSRHKNNGEGHPRPEPAERLRRPRHPEAGRRAGGLPPAPRPLGAEVTSRPMSDDDASEQ